MLNSKSFLAVDFGAGSLKLAEFEINEAGGLRLKQYGIRPLGPEGAQEGTREATILKVLQTALTETGVKSKAVNVCAPGFHVFSKFVKLPPVDAGKVTQIIEYEAKSNVPFPLQRLPLQLRRTRRLHHAARYRGQDQQPPLLRKRQSLLSQHQSWRQFHHRRLCQRI